MESLNSHSILQMIFSYLPPEDVHYCLLVNSEFYNAINNNWRIMQKDNACIELNKHLTGYDVYINWYSGSYGEHLERHQSYTRTVGRGPRVRVTDYEFCFAVELERFARLLSNERGNPRGDLPKHLMMLNLKIDTQIAGLNEVLMCLSKRLNIRCLTLSPKYQRGGRADPMYKRRCEPFTQEELVNIHKSLKTTLFLSSVSTSHTPYCSELVTIHNRIQGKGHISLNVHTFDDALLSLDTNHVITVKYKLLNFATLARMMEEWLEGKRTLRYLSVLGSSENKVDVSEDADVWARNFDRAKLEIEFDETNMSKKYRLIKSETEILTMTTFTQRQKTYIHSQTKLNMERLLGHSILPMVFSYLSPKDVHACLQVNSVFHSTINNNWRMMQKDDARIELNKLPTGCCDVYIECTREDGSRTLRHHSEELGTCGYKVRITNREIGFDVDHERFARLLSSERGNPRGVPELDEMLLTLKIASMTAGLNEVLTCLAKRLNIRYLTLKTKSPFYMCDTYDTFSEEELACIHKSLRFSSFLSMVKTFRRPYSAELIAIHNLLQGRGHISMSVNNFNDSMFTLDTRNVIIINCYWMNFSTLGCMMQVGMELLGESILPMVFSYLSPKHLHTCLQVNSLFHSTINNNWDIMQKDPARIKLNKLATGYDVNMRDEYDNIVYHKCKGLRSVSNKVRITNRAIGFDVEHERFARLLSSERGNPRGVPALDEMMLNLKIPSMMAGLNEVLMCLSKRLYIRDLTISLSDIRCDPFSKKELACIHKSLTFSSYLSMVRTSHTPLSAEIITFHNHLRGKGHIFMHVHTFDDSMLALDTKNVIIINCDQMNFSTLGRMMQEWLDGTREILHIVISCTTSKDVSDLKQGLLNWIHTVDENKIEILPNNAFRLLKSPTEIRYIQTRCPQQIGFTTRNPL